MKRAKLRTKKPVLIMLYGFPGAGKTHFSKNLAEHLQAAHVHGDRIRFELFEQPRYDRQENGIVAQLMEYMTEEFLGAGISVIYDVNAARLSQRRALREIARKNKAQSTIIWFQVDPETAYDRTQRRDRRKTEDRYRRDYTYDLFSRYISHMQQPKNEDYVVVSGKHTFESQRTAIFKRFMELGYVEQSAGQEKVTKPGLINLVPRGRTPAARLDHRRNINIH